ncbi:MAG: DUF3047 domain-containing protein [Casimicrobiaceae bacterium]
MLAALLAINPPSAQPQPANPLRSFSDQTPGEAISGWTVEPIRGVRSLTRYRLVPDSERGVVLEGMAEASAGALVTRLEPMLAEGLLLEFSWKIELPVPGSDPRNKATDDYPARVYVTFTRENAQLSLRERAENAFARALYGEEPPAAALNYIALPGSAPEAIFTSLFTERVRMIAVDTRATQADGWQTFRRDIAADFRRAFGSVPGRVTGVAVMVDADNTKTRARARFGDIRLLRRSAQAAP